MRKKTFFKGVLLLLLLMLLPLGAFGQLITGTTATASDEAQPASRAVDGDAGSRWETAGAAGDPQWILVDLGAEYNVGKVELIWEGASAADYTLQGSIDNVDWDTISIKTGLAGARTDEITGINTTYRYIKMLGTVRSTPWGYSIWEFKVYQAAVPVLTTIDVSPAAASILPGETKLFTAVGKDQLGDPFTFTNTTAWSVNGSGCSIGEDGMLATTVDGNYTITATNTGISGTASLTVYTPELTTLNITPANASINAGDPQQFTVTGKDQIGVDMAITSQTWSVSGAECSIDNDGLLTTNAGATGYFYATVTATGANGTVSKNVSFSVGNYAKGAIVTASSGNGALAVDGDAGSRWESAPSDPQSLIIDLGNSKNIGVIRISWEGANSKDYTISFSNTNDGTDWADTITKINMPEGARKDIISDLDLNYQYIKIEGTARNLTYGHSIFEFEVYGKTAPFLSSVVVIPSTATMTAGETQTFTAEGRDQNGNVFALTGATSWSVNGTGSSIDINGLLATTKPGTYTVTGINGSYSGTASVDVLPSDANIAIGKNATASSGIASAAFDDNAGTRWESASLDPQSIVVDLGVINNITGVRIVWEAANAKNYTIEGSNDSIDWTEFISKTNMPVGARTDAIYDLIGCNYRYVRLIGTTRTTGYGYSIWEFKIYGAAKTAPVITWENPADINYGTLLSAAELNATADVAGTLTYTPAIDFKMNAGLNQDLRVDFKPTDELTYASATKTVQINVNKATPVITWANPSDITYGTLISTVQQNATADIDGAFVYSAAIDSVLNAGDAQDLTVDFTPTNTVNYNSVSKTVQINVNKATPVITWANPSDITYGTVISAVQQNATADVDGAFVYSAAIDSVLNAGDAQDLTVDFTPTNTINYNSVSKTVQINVNKANPFIAWANPSDITYGTVISAVQHNATADIDGVFEYSAAIDSVLNAGDAQDITVDFTPTNTVNYNSASKTVQINVNKANPVITWANPSDITYGTVISAVQQNATADVDGAFEYSAAIDSVLNAGDAQDITVDFTPTNTANYNSVSKTVQINVNKATPVITWANPSDITYGTVISAVQQNATADVDGAFEYSAAIDSVLNAGDAQDITVDFTPTNTANYNSVSKTVQINVNKATPVITWANPLDITYGTNLATTELNATCNVDGIFTYTPALNEILNAGDAQNLKVDFVPTDVLNYELGSKTVHINVKKANPVIAWADPAEIAYGTLLSVSQLNASSTIGGAYLYSPAMGTKLDAGNNQNLTVDFSPTDAANYNSVSKTVQINVTKANPVITWNSPADIMVGTTLSGTQLNASSAVAGLFAYNPAAGTVLSIADNQNLSVEFTPTDVTNYNVVSKTVTINVLDPGKTTPVITWANPSNITYGTLLSEMQLNATSGGVDGTFVYTPVLGSKLDAGANIELKVVFTPTDAGSYNSASKIVHLNVLKANPIITWIDAADISYGTLLSATQLNASADISGNFVYDPAIGAKLSVGANQNLTVDFTPLDGSNFANASKTVKINVTNAVPEITWTNPSDIIYGTLLSATQLNAISGGIAGTFTYTPEVGTKLAAGNNRELKVDFIPTDAASYSSVSKTVLINVLKATSTISWAIPANIVYGEKLSTTQLNATANVAGTFTYTPELGTTLNAAENQELKVDFVPSDTSYTIVSKTVKINVLAANPVITWNNPSDIVYGTLLSSDQLNAIANTEGEFTYSPDLGTKLEAGEHDLKVDFVSTNANYNSASKIVKIKVSETASVITWSAPEDIVYGTLLDSNQLNATANIEGEFTYTPDLGTKLAAGEHDLKVDFVPVDASYMPASKTVKINVAKATSVITWSAPLEIVYGTSLSSDQLNATANTEGEFTYTPDLGTKLATGEHDLQVDFVAVDTNYTTESKTVKINVYKATPVISWENPADIKFGELLSETQLNATTGNVNGTLVYSPALNSKLNAGNNQELKVDFTPDDTDNYNTVSMTVKINVSPIVPVISWATPADITYGTLLGSDQLNASVEGISGTLVYTPALNSKLNAGNNQELKVDFTPDDTDNYGTASMTVKINVSSIVPVISWATPADITYGTLLGTDQLNASVEGIAGTLVYSPALNSKLNAGNNQELKVDFTPDDTDNYSTASMTVKINVSSITPVISWAKPADITYGTLLGTDQLNASVEGIAGTFVYTPAFDSKLNAGNNQELKVDFIPDDAVNYTSASITVGINVGKATPVISWDNPAGITFGEKLSVKQLNAGVGNAAGILIYTPAIGSKLNAGNDQELKVDFTPTDAANYNAVSGSVKINVAKATPVITWSNPNNIKEGAALSATQLNASSDVEGTLVYTPAAGTVLGVGNGQELKVDFTPANAANYNSVSKTVKINVTPVTSVASVSDVKVQVYPNPFAEKLLIKNAGAFSKVVVCDLMGKVVYTSNIQTAEAELPLSNLKGGNYLIVLTGKNVKETLSIIKK